MAGNVTGLHGFADDVGPIPLSLLDGNYNALVVALNTLSTFSNFYVDTGTTNNINVTTPATQFVSYADGLTLTVRVANTTTGPVTLNVNSMGPRAVLDDAGTALTAGYLFAGQTVTVVYDASKSAFVLPSGGSGGGGAGGVVNAPFSVMSTSGQSAFTVNADGSGYLGAFGGHGLTWDTAGNFTLEGGATLPGGGGTVPGGPPYTFLSPVTITPGSGVTLTLDGETNQEVLRVSAASNTAPAFMASFQQNNSAIGNSMGVYIQAGTNASDKALTVYNQAGTAEMFTVSGDGSGALGNPATSQLLWDAAGTFYVGSTQLAARATPSQTMCVITRPTAPTQAGAWLQDIGGKSVGITTPTAQGMSNGLCIAAGTDVTDASLYVIDAAGTANFMRIKGDGSGYLGPTQAMTWSPAGTTTFTAPDQATVPLQVLMPPATTPNQWFWEIGGGGPSGASPGCSNGLYIAAGTNASDAALWVQNDGGSATFFKIDGDGSGTIGPAARHLNWDINGNFATGAPLHLGPSADPNGAALIMAGPPHEVPNQWFFQIGGGTTGCATGCSNGLYIGAGTDSGDCALWVQDDTSTNTYLQVLGDGEVFMPHLPTTALSGNLYIDANGKLYRSTVGVVAAGIDTVTTDERAAPKPAKRGRHFAERLILWLWEGVPA